MHNKWDKMNKNLLMDSVSLISDHIIFYIKYNIHVNKKNLYTD